MKPDEGQAMVLFIFFFLARLLHTAMQAGQSSSCCYVDVLKDEGDGIRQPVIPAQPVP